jgi:iron complex transport system ATP-binding protein
VTEAAPVVALRGVVVRRAGRTILGPIDWSIGPGERWVVLGPNGSGKTTLLSVAGLELWPTSGSSRSSGRDTGGRFARASEAHRVGRQRERERVP